MNRAVAIVRGRKEREREGQRAPSLYLLLDEAHFSWLADGRRVLVAPVDLGVDGL